MIDRLRRDDSAARSFTLCLIDATPTERAEQFGADLQFIYTKLRSTPVSVAFVPETRANLELLMELLRRPATSTPGSSAISASSRQTQRPSKEQTVSDFPFDKAEFKSKISEILREIHEEEDPIEMTRIKRMVRRHTSIFNRGYITAYLLKQAMTNGSRPRKKRAEQVTTNEDQQSIFVSIGRNRRVHTRDLITFFTSVDGIGSEDIGQIKVLDNYSFVELNKDKAQAAIEALNGQELRGRKLTVNFARRK
jgi:hypothetical protein